MLCCIFVLWELFYLSGKLEKIRKARSRIIVIELTLVIINFLLLSIIIIVWVKNTPAINWVSNTRPFCWSSQLRSIYSSSFHYSMFLKQSEIQISYRKRKSNNQQYLSLKLNQLVLKNTGYFLHFSQNNNKHFKMAVLRFSRRLSTRMRTTIFCPSRP